MATKVKRSVAPIYLIGAVWLVSGLFFSLYTPMDYLRCALLSVAAFVVGKALFPDKSFQVAEEAPSQPTDAPKAEAQAQPASPPKSSGDPEIDKLIRERERAVSEMRRLNDNIKDETISAQIDHLEQVTQKIIGVVVDDPKKLPQIRRFLDYYLPTTLKLLNAYDRMDSAGIAGDNISATKQKVEGMMDTISQAFDKQLDALFGDEALDISTDITVMENMLAREGLGGLQM